MRETRSNGAVIDYSYDANGNPFKIVVNVNGSRYAGYFLVNQMGDVIGIVDGSGNIVVWYRYNAWGKLISYDYTAGTGVYLATYNCLRYRGYYFDSNLGMYYLQSRFYDPTLCRFVNADKPTNLAANSDFASLNLYAYCGNHPTSRRDEGGAFWNYVIGAGAGALIGVLTTAFDIYQDGGFDAVFSEKGLSKIGVSAICGAINGLTAASGAYFLLAGTMGTVTGFLESMSHELIDNDGFMSEESWRDVATDTIAGGIGGLVGGNGAVFGNKYMSRQTTRFLEKSITKGSSYFYKMTAKYSKQFITPTVVGIGKGWIGTQVTSRALTY